jgi:hypothetical protein
MKTSIIVGLSLLAASAQAQQPRSVEYFIMHNDARVQVERTCFGGVGQPLHEAECINAHQADQYLYAAAAQQNAKRILNFLEDPQYYAEHPLSRMMVTKDCLHPASALHYTDAVCQAARAGGN